MSNFIGKANDLLQGDRDKYAYFSHMLQSIQQDLAYLTLYYHADLRNIEEVLSILEMQRVLGKPNTEVYSKYKDFIIDVIENYTKPIPSPPLIMASRGRFLSPQGTPQPYTLFPDNWMRYVSFVAHLFNATLTCEHLQADEYQVDCKRNAQADTDYW